MKVCVSCQLPKEEEEFNWRWKALGIRAKSAVSAKAVIKEQGISITRNRKKNG